MYDVLIVEDDAQAAEALGGCLARYGQEKGLAFRVSWLASALEFMERRPQADLIFMDIDMPGLTGMEAAEDLRSYDSETPLVFVTNLAQYAVHGYAVDATDFIVKPVEYGPFSLRMARVMRVLERRASRRPISVPTKEGMRLFAAGDVVYVEVDGHYLRYHLADGSEARTRGTMRQVEEDLRDEAFVRVANGLLVNAQHVRQLRRDEIVLSTGEVLWFSRARRKEAQAQIVRLLGERRS